ncbi:prepilin peptidase [Candidatus Woesearchaeota archaeon]|nr:prepilin peptidase [Candidatus Woesearchaeota archaeon]
MLIDWILTSIAVFWLFAASLFDLRTREIPDWLSYSLFFIGLGIRGIYSILYANVWFFLYGIIGAGIFFIIASSMYYTKQWGGGDSKLLIGLGAVFGTAPQLGFVSFPPGLIFLGYLFVNLFIVGAFYGVLWAVGLAFIHRKEIKYSLVRNWFIGMIVSGVSLTAIYYFAPFSTVFYAVLLLTLVVLILLSYPLLKTIETLGLVKNVPVTQLTEGDWPVEDIQIGKKIIYHAKGLGLEKKHLVQLKKLKRKSILIKQGIPFVPSFFIGLLLTLLFGLLFPLASLLAIAY